MRASALAHTLSVLLERERSNVLKAPTLLLTQAKRRIAMPESAGISESNAMPLLCLAGAMGATDVLLRLSLGSFEVVFHAMCLFLHMVSCVPHVETALRWWISSPAISRPSRVMLCGSPRSFPPTHSDWVCFLSSLSRAAFFGHVSRLRSS